MHSNRAGRTRKGRPAFTLVEALLVTSIIALLIAIFLPGLRRAREQGRRAVCGVHQRQIVNAWETYAFYASALPIMNRQGFDINYRYDPPTREYVRQPINGFGPETWAEYLHAKNFWTGAPFRGIIFQIDIHTGMNEHDFGQWRNFGLLWESRSIGDPRGLFCPSQRDPFFAWDTPYNPWPPSLETARRPDDPRYANHTESSFERRLGLTGVPWDRISPRVALVTDRLLDDDESPRIIERTHGIGATCAFRDGHVVFIRDERFRTWTREGASWNRLKRDLLAMYDWLDHQFNR